MTPEQWADRLFNMDRYTPVHTSWGQTEAIIRKAVAEERAKIKEIMRQEYLSACAVDHQTERERGAIHACNAIAAAIEAGT